MDNTSLIRSFIHSDTFTLIGTYLILFKCLVRLTTQHIHWYTGNSAILSNNFVSLLSDLQVRMCTYNYENGIPNWKP